jgi:N6-adenosine-specific RNA methylase IME4
LTIKAGVIYADPNWNYGNFGAKKHGSPKTHYGTSPVEDICKIPVAQWAKKDCILALCFTFPKLEEAFTVARAWGFNEYVTGIPWIKTSPNSKQPVPDHPWGEFVALVRGGIGFWFQGTAEGVLFFRKGNPPSPGGNATKKRVATKGILCGSEGAIFAPIKGHSAKPLLFYDWMRLRLKGPYLELFARNEIYEWTCWGKDTGYWLDENGVHPYVPEAQTPPPPPPNATLIQT